MSFERGDIVWVIDKRGGTYSEGFIESKIVKKVMPYHGISFDKDNTKWYVSVPHYDFSTPYLESDLKDWINQKI